MSILVTENNFDALKLFPQTIICMTSKLDKSDFFNDQMVMINQECKKITLSVHVN